jgi:hypothetical protein
MSKEIPMTNHELSEGAASDLTFGFRHSLVIKASSFVIFHGQAFRGFKMFT